MKGGLTQTRTGRSWRAMIRRCYCKNEPSYDHYGGSGITVCEFLRASVFNLIEVLGHRPEGHTLDRINGSLGYWCGQCSECYEKNRSLNIRWATPKQQAMNTAINRLVTIGSTTLCISEWAEKIGVSDSTFSERIDRGWNPEQLLMPKISRRSRDWHGHFSKEVQ